jgi:HAD superfamily, subfamily IIIB (Acid phosphatase)
MSRPLRALLLLAAGFALGAIAVGGAVAAKYVTGGDTEVKSIKLTGLGLPNVGGTSTYGVAELPASIRSYHDSGAYEADLAKVDTQARKSLAKQLQKLLQSPGPGKYSECKRKGRKCHKVRPAIVLDIDETSLSNYAGLDAADFSATGTVPGVVAGNDPAIAPTLALYGFARSKGVDVFFITGRPESLQSVAQTNLTNVGYDEGFNLITKPPDAGTTIEYKSGARARIEEELGRTILINVGDQDSDLAGGHARKAFKLPNPMYFIP